MYVYCDHQQLQTITKSESARFTFHVVQKICCLLCLSFHVFSQKVIEVGNWSIAQNNSTCTTFLVHKNRLNYCICLTLDTKLLGLNAQTFHVVIEQKTFFKNNLCWRNPNGPKSYRKETINRKVRQASNPHACPQQIKKNAQTVRNTNKRITIFWIDCKWWK